MTPIVIVGAGMGGLAAAVELARRGEEVLVLEPRHEVGGKARAMMVGGRMIDVGPTVLTMRWVFDELFASSRRSLDQSVELRPLDVVARNVFADGSHLDLSTSVERNADAIAAFSSAREAAAYRRFAAYSAAISATAEEAFLRSQRPSLSSLLFGAGRLGLGALRRIDAHRTMWSAIGSFFDDPRLRALFARYATYVGSSPFEAAATFNLIAHVERSGVVGIEGGISRLAGALADVAIAHGATIHTSTTVDDIVVADGRVSAVTLVSKDGARATIPARAVIANADVATLAAGAFGRAAAASVEAPLAARRSLSAMTWAVAGEASGTPLAHHSVFFSADYEAETRALWNERAFPADPTVYVCAAEPGAFFLIANAPAGAHDLTQKEIESCERIVFSRLSRAGLTIAPAASIRMTPADFARLAPGTGGAIYGEAAHGPMAALSRQGARTKLRGLYVAGGSVHPGPGVPMAALSGRRAAEALLADLAPKRTIAFGSLSTP